MKSKTFTRSDARAFHGDTRRIKENSAFYSAGCYFETFLKRKLFKMLTMMSEEMYTAYLVRIWQDEARGHWRAQVIPVGAPNSEARFFTDPAQLLVYWLGETAVAGPQPPTSQGEKSQ